MKEMMSIRETHLVLEEIGNCFRKMIEGTEYHDLLDRQSTNVKFDLDRSEFVKSQSSKTEWNHERNKIYEIRDQILKDYKNTCQHCFERFPDFLLHCHHLIPIDKGGKTELNNLKLVCRKCHKLIHKETEND